MVKDLMIKLCYLNRIFSKSITLLVAIHLVSCSANNDVSGLISSMTLEEKIGQMTQVDYRYLQNVTDINKYFLGSILRVAGPRLQRTNLLLGLISTTSFKNKL